MRSTSPNILSEEQRKYLYQPSYVRLGMQSIVYHQYRKVKLELVTESALINDEALRNFYAARIKLFPNTGRELEVQEDPDALYLYH
jgi:hypothetical protein